MTEMPSTAGPNSPSAKPAGGEIVISDFGYTVPASVSPGQQVTIVNNDSMAHTITADNKAFEVQAWGSGGITTLTAPATPGVYPFHCNYHNNMHGTLTVQ